MRVLTCAEDIPKSTVSLWDELTFLQTLCMRVVLELGARCWQESAALQQGVSLWLGSNTQPTVTPLKGEESQ